MKTLSTLCLLFVTTIHSHYYISNCNEPNNCTVSKKLLVSAPKTDSTTVPGIDFKQMILFDNKLIIAEEGPEASTETNIQKYVINQFQLSEIILDCANGFFPCSTTEQAKIHSGKVGEAFADSDVKEFQDKTVGPGIFESFTDACLVFNQVDENLSISASKKLVIVCQPKEAEYNQNLHNFMKDFGPTLIKYNFAFKSYMNGLQNSIAVRSARCKGFDATEKIFLGHVVVYKNRIGLQSDMDEFGMKNSVMEAYQTQMLPLMKENEALIANNKDGFCFFVQREGSDPFNFCFDNKRLRDIIMMTAYNNQMLYKMQENGQLLTQDSLNCDEVKTYQMLKNAWEIDQIKPQYPADYADFIDQSRKFFLKQYENSFSPPPIEGEVTVALAIEKLYSDCESQLAAFKPAQSLSFIQVRASSFIQVQGKDSEKTDEPSEDELKWMKKLKRKMRTFVPLPDIRIPVFDKAQCKEGEDTFMCMTDFLSKHYNRIKCDPRLKKQQQGKQLYGPVKKDENEFVTTC